MNVLLDGPQDVEIHGDRALVEPLDAAIATTMLSFSGSA